MTTSRARRAGGGAAALVEQLHELRRLLERQQEQLSAQQEQLAVQQEAIARLRAERAEATPASPLILPAKFRGRGTAADDATPERTNCRHTSRRGLLKLGGVAAAVGLAAGAGELLRPGTAHAAGRRAANATEYQLAGGAGNVAILGQGVNGANGIIGQSDSAYGLYGLSQTNWGVLGASTSGSAVLGDTVSGGGSGTGVVGQAASGRGVLGTTVHGDAGVYGYASAGAGRGVIGESYGGVGVAGYADGTSYGVFGQGAAGGVYGTGTDAGVIGVSPASWGVLAQSGTGVDLYAAGTGRIKQWPQRTVWPPTVGSWFAGEQVRDANQDLWICVQDGTPGHWRKVAAPQYGYAGGALNLLPTPIRLLDTRAGSPIGNLRTNTPVAYRATINVPAAGVTYSGQTIPAGAVAVFGLLTAALAPGVNPGDGSSAICWATGTPLPNVVNVVFNPQDRGGAYTSDFTLVQCGAGGDISIYNQPINSGVAVDYMFDCFGFVM